ncbi:murein biosynthesis integral membrane protein MurJ [Buchnera aphidicola]|uniref:murein biosynthesis integral membrane protein MurJ n=1 Tax=Buchnera aphidicola TaxID=9 RepID=UPI0031B864DE
MYLLKSIISIGIVTILCRILGFIRDFLIAFIFGTSLETDAFFVALKIPNLLRRIFSEGAFSQAFIPILSEYKKIGNIKLMNNFISAIFSILMIVMIIIVFFSIFFSGLLVKIISPGFSNNFEQLLLTKNLLQIILPYVFLISIVNFYTAILNIYNVIILPTFLPIIFNLTMIIFIWFILPFFNKPIYALSCSVLFSGIFQLLYQFFLLYKEKIIIFPKIDMKNIGLIRVYKKFLTGIFSSAIIQVSLLVNNIFASLLIPKSLSWIYYADRLMEFPLAILSVSLTTVLLPLLSKNYLCNEKKFFKLFNWGIRISFLLGIPSALFLAILTNPIVKVLFQYGNFTALDSLMTSQILFVYSFGLIAFILIKILSLGFYSRQDTITPMKISLFSVIIIQIINIIGINFFKHCTFAISISIGSWVNVFLLYYNLYKKHNFIIKLKSLNFFLSITLASLVMSIYMLYILKIMPEWDIGYFYNKIINLFFLIFSSIFLYFFVFFLLGYRLINFICFKKK